MRITNSFSWKPTLLSLVNIISLQDETKDSYPVVYENKCIFLSSMELKIKEMVTVAENTGVK